ncbi:MAG: hypothetical protein VYE22_14130 [Myxococcota bacterium]|nr:hypothetical protein [Myxococcota bacterium]
MRPLFALTLACLLGCAAPSTPPSAAQRAKASVLLGFADQVQAASRDPGAFAALFDRRALAERMAPPGMTAAERSAFVRGAEEGLGDSLGGLLQEIAATDYAFRGVVWRDGLPTARFRMVAPEGGFNFHDMAVVVDETGAARIVDLYVMTSGEYLSETMQRLATVAWGQGGALGRLLGREGLSQAQLERVQALVTASSEGRAEDALAVYEQLDPRLKDQSFVQLIRVQAGAQLADDGRYLAILDDASRRLGDDPAVEVMMLDAYTLRQDWGRCATALESIRREFDDPFLDAMLARTLAQDGRAAEGLALAREAVAEEPGLLDTHDALLFTALVAGDEETAARAMDRLESEFEVDRFALAAQPGYEGVLTLPVGAADE